MPQKIRLWEASFHNTPVEILSGQIPFEDRLEDWLASDISMLDQSLLVIGRQVQTDFRGRIDLLCISSTGDIVIVELKRGQTPREVTAQALDYAAWVQTLSFSRIKSIADEHLAKGANPLELDTAFRETFGAPLPEELNTTNHRILIVAESMDASTERIVSYLSDRNVPINVATIQYFKSDDGRELLAQVFLVEPEVAAAREQIVSKGSRPPYVTAAEMAAVAEEKGVGTLYRALSEGSSPMMRASSFGRDRRGFQVVGGGRTLAVLIVRLGESSQQDGMMFQLNGIRLMNHFGLDADQLAKSIPEGVDSLDLTDWVGSTAEEEANWIGYRGYFRTVEEVDSFLTRLKEGSTA